MTAISKLHGRHRSGAERAVPGTRTLFRIELTTGRARIITKFSLVPSEAEVLLPPNSRFAVLGQLDAGNGLIIIALKELPSRDPIVVFRPVPAFASAAALPASHCQQEQARCHLPPNLALLHPLSPQSIGRLFCVIFGRQFRRRPSHPSFTIATCRLLLLFKGNVAMLKPLKQIQQTLRIMRATWLNTHMLPVNLLMKHTPA